MTREGVVARMSLPGTASSPVFDRPVELLAALLAGVAAVGLAVVRAVGNAPPTAGAVGTDLITVASTVALVGPAVAAVVLATTTDDDRELFGLLAVGVFALFTGVSSAATVPAVGAFVAGGALAVAGGRSWRRSWRSARRALVAGAVLAGVAVSLGSATGLIPAGARPLGAHLALLGVAASVVFVRPGALGWFAGVLAAFGVVAAGVTLPFVTGAVVLIAGGVVGASIVVLAAGVGGGVATAVGAVTAGQVTAALGAASLLAAGAPVTPTRAVAAVVGLALLVRASNPGVPADA